MDPITIGLLAALTAGSAGINYLENKNKRDVQERENARIKDANKWGLAHSFGGKIGNQMSEVGPYEGPSDLGAAVGGGVSGLESGIGLANALNFGKNNITSGTVPNAASNNSGYNLGAFGGKGLVDQDLLKKLKEFRLK